MTPLKLLIETKWKHDCSKTKMPPAYVPRDTFKVNTANGLTKACVTWINLNGGLAERISSTGRMIDNTKVVTNVIGQQYRIGSIGYIPGTTRNGTADVAATFRNKAGQVVSWKIEIKIGADRQSPAQKKYQEDTERAGGVYSLIRTYDQFYAKWLTLTTL
jgi:hypothetical protein